MRVMSATTHNFQARPTNYPLTLSSNRIAYLVLLLMLYCLPPLLLWRQVISPEFRFHILGFLTAVMICCTVSRKYNFKELGFRTDTLKDSLIWNACLSLIFMTGMYIAYMANLIRKPTVPDWKFFYVFYIFFCGPSQEFLFRSVVFAEMNRARNIGPILQVLISALIYCFMHIFYNDLITLGVTLLMGILWGIIYYKYPNFWGVTFSHAILGVVSIEIGLI
jgi:uncharacterized protein